MKAGSITLGTVLLATLDAPGKEKLNLAQVMIVTPAIASALGLSYQTLWEALSKDQPVPYGSPIQVRLVSEAGAKIAIPGPVATLPLEKATVVPERNAFMRM